MKTEKSSLSTKDPQHLIRPAATFSPSDAEKGNPLGEGGVDLSAARRGIEQTAPFAPQVESYIEKPEVALRLGICVRSLDSWIKRKNMIPYYKLGRTVRFKWSEIEAHLAATCRVGRGR